MSLQSAMQVLETAPRPQDAKIETPQATQEIKENATNSLKTAEKDGAVEAPKATAEAATSPSEDKTETKKEEPISSKFAALAKKEKQIVRQQQEFKTMQAEFEKSKLDITAREAKIAESESLWNTDPFKALELRGYTYQKLTDLVLSGEKAPKQEPEDPATLAQRKIDEWEKRQTEKETAREAQAKKEQEEKKQMQQSEVAEAYETYRQEIRDHISTFPAEYELIETFGQQELIIETVQQFYEEHKRVLSVKEAADMVESYLYDEAQKAQKTKKFSTKKEEPKSEKKEPTKEASKTLNNQMTPTAASILPAASEADRMKRAMAALNR